MSFGGNRLWLKVKQRQSKSINIQMEKIMSTEVENKLFSFLPMETTDKNRIAEILAPIYTSNEASRFFDVRLVDGEKDMLTPLGKEVARILAVKATEFPFLRIFHYYKLREEKREFTEYHLKLDDPRVYPTADADSQRSKYVDVWDDERFFELLDNKNGEVSSTCKIVECRGCKGSGYIDYVYDEKTKISMTCPRCDGSGLEGVHECPRCKGKGWVPGTRTSKEKCKTVCGSCGGVGKVKSVLCAYHSRESVSGYNTVSTNSFSSSDEKKEVRLDNVREIKWCRILVHEPNLCEEKLWDGDLDWSLLKDDESKKAARIKAVKRITAKEGVIDPSKNDLSDLPLANKEDLKRIYDECYPTVAKIPYPKKSAFFVLQDAKKDTNCRAICSDEDIKIVTGVGWVRIEMQDGGAFWVNTLTKKLGTGLDWFYKEKGKCHITEYSPEIQRAIKEAKKSLLKCKKPLSKSANDLSSDKEWKEKLQGCGCLLALAAIAGFLIWWWLEGFTMAALPGMWTQAKNAVGGEALKVIGAVCGSVLGVFLLWKLLKSKKDDNAPKSTKKRWVFIVLGLLLGPFGVHFLYAKRWFLFLLLWAAFVTGGVMSDGKPEKAAGDVAATQAVQQADGKKKDSGSPVGDIGFAVWALLWIGGTLFIKKDGKGNRM